MSMSDERRVSAITLWVSDLEASAAFYREVVGIPVEHSDPHEPENLEHYELMWGEWGEKGPVEPYLWFDLFPAQGTVTRGVRLGLSVPSIEEAQARASERGVTIVSGPTQVPWGRELLIEDPDGNLVALTSV